MLGKVARDEADDAEAVPGPSDPRRYGDAREIVGRSRAGGRELRMLPGFEGNRSMAGVLSAVPMLAGAQPDALERLAATATVLRVRGPRKFLMVILPSAAPFIATGLRVAVAVALIVDIIAELIGGGSGIGERILVAENAGPSAYPVMYAYIVVAGIPGEEATVKTFLRKRNKIVLRPSNATMEDLVYDPAEVQIYGKLVTLLRRL